MSIVLVLSTAPDTECAQKLARALVEEQLAACVSIIPAIQSVYRWQGQIECASELQLLIKTTEACCAALQQRLLQLHPYELPEILIFKSAAGLPAYMDWVAASVSPPAREAL